MFLIPHFFYIKENIFHKYKKEKSQTQQFQQMQRVHQIQWNIGKMVEITISEFEEKLKLHQSEKQREKNKEMY